MVTFNRTVTALMLVLTALIFGMANVDTAQAHGDSHRRIQPCENDEGASGVPKAKRPCAWDARHQGDGNGTSFVIRRDGRTQHVSHHFAHHAIQAWINAPTSVNGIRHDGQQTLPIESHSRVRGGR